ncbi:translation initiation factor IF-3 [Candidatus Deianiraea vastatrix]|uniref:Translation initiation factor IF-3 n=1 Tax=Candidatus Deianiraea vastatrix TaxID=2163644 RepID=A0A5B8XDM8_9RICK|nr:translation initiation factor IF-3 [Candidatus Deianiraea vastatrix]QED23340.1 Translation initiation factor IF-3 [Candidatus Deianiraea vastatrix]
MFFVISSKVKINISYKINNQIVAKSVRVIDSDGNALGILSREEALLKAGEFKLDLIEISPNSEPPVCKIANFGKMRYELQKKEIEKRKNTKKVDTKEIRIGVNIGEHDYNVKLNHAKKFIEDGDKVKFVMLLRGRQNHHKDIGIEMFGKIKIDMQECAKIDSDISSMGNQIFMCFSAKT